MALATSLALAALMLHGATAAPARKSIADLERENVRLRTALAICQQTKTSRVGDAARQEAIIALRATDSPIQGGENVSEYKHYALKAKVLTDMLPADPASRPVKHGAEIYADATSLLIAWQIGAIDSGRMQYFRTKYSDDAGFMKIFGGAPEGGFARDGDVLERQLGEIAAQYGGQYLLVKAREELMLLK